MPNSLEDLLGRLREDRTLFQSGEEAARQGAVLPILRRLGWDRDNIFLEVQRTNEELEKHQEQLLGYAFRDGVRLAVLTNGLLWWLYLPLLQGSWEQRKFFAIDIQQQALAEAAGHFREFLSRDAVASGRAFEQAQAVDASGEKARVIRQTIQPAWRQFCEAPDEMLLELLADRVESLCGHRPDQESLAEFLAAQQSGPGMPPPVSKAPTASTKPSARRPVPALGAAFEGPYTGTKPRAYAFGGQRYEVSTFKDILVGLCSSLYRAHAGDFERVLMLHGRKRQYFSRSFEGMNSPRGIAGSGIYVETNLSANMVMDRCADLLQLFGYPREQLQVERESGPG